MLYYSVNLKLYTHSSFKGIHLTSKCLNLASIVIGLLLGHSQSIIVPGCSIGEVSKLAVDKNRERKEEVRKITAQ